MKDELMMKGFIFKKFEILLSLIILLYLIPIVLLSFYSMEIFHPKQELANSLSRASDELYRIPRHFYPHAQLGSRF